MGPPGTSAALNPPCSVGPRTCDPGPLPPHLMLPPGPRVPAGNGPGRKRRDRQEEEGTGRGCDPALKDGGREREGKERRWTERGGRGRKGATQDGRGNED